MLRRAAWPLLAAFLACGGSTVAGNNGDASADAALGDGSGPACGEPASSPAGAPSGRGGDTVYAVDQFFLGDVGFDGSPSADAWKTIGFDLDHVDTTDPAKAPNCSGLDPSALLDGACGIDNAFGHSLAGTVVTSAAQSALAKSGEWTLLIQVSGHDNLTNETGVSGAIFAAAPTAAPPLFDGSDVWSPTTDSEPAGVPLARFTNGYVVDGKLFVTEPLIVLMDLPSGSNGRHVRFQVHVKAVTAEFTPDLTAISRGVIAGIIVADDLTTAAKSCTTNAGLDGRAHADILTDRTSSSSRPCDGVSIGIGFTARAIRRLGDAMPAPTPFNVCTDGG